MNKLDTVKQALEFYADGSGVSQDGNFELVPGGSFQEFGMLAGEALQALTEYIEMLNSDELVDEMTKPEEDIERATIYLDKYVIGKLDDDQINISIIGDGEGGTFSLQEFEKVVDKFYNDNF